MLPPPMASTSTRTRRPWWRRVQVVWVAVVVSLFVSRSVAAHPLGISSFEARTEGNELQFWFKLNGISVIHLLNRLHPGGTPLDGEAVPGAKDEIVRYFDQRFFVSNDGQVCKRRDDVYYRAHLDRNKVSFNVVFECERELDVVEIRSTLFLDEDTPHQVLGTVRHRQALERYFFTGGERVATIDLDRLPQRPGLVFDKRAPFRSAAPPPGARLFPPGQGPGEGPQQNPQAVAAVDQTAEPLAAMTAMAISPSAAASVAEPQATVVGFLTFVEQGVVHIFGGLDHVLFVIALLVALTDWRRLAWVLTAFTLAHSITLALGSFGLVVVSSALVEPIIAASIVYVAVENLVQAKAHTRARVAFGFGLVHGLGFSSVLAEIGLPQQEFASSLLAFNLGVELGQLAIVAPIWPLWMWLRRRPKFFSSAYVALNVAVAVVAVVWVVERVWG